MNIETLTRYVKTKLSSFDVPTSKTLKDILLRIIIFIEEYIKDTVDNAVENISGETSGSKEIIFSKVHPTTLEKGEYYFNILEDIPLFLKAKFPSNPTVKTRFKITILNFETGIIGAPFSFGYTDPCDINVTDPRNKSFFVAGVDASTLPKVLDIIGNIVSEETESNLPEELWTVIEKGSDYIILEYNRPFKMTDIWSLSVRPEQGSSPREYFFVVEEVASSCSTWVNAFGDMFFGDEENTINNP